MRGSARHGTALCLAPLKEGIGTLGSNRPAPARERVGYLALFVALTATAWAAPKITSKQLGKNAVKSKHVKDGKIGNRDLADGAVNSAKVADDALTGADIDESTLAQGPGAAPAWGDLTGVPAGFADDDDDHVPDAGEVDGPSIANGAITDDDISGAAAISDSKLATQMGVMTGRVNGLPSAGSTRFAAASDFTDATAVLSDVTSLSPATPLEAGALSVS